jgi:hypothetical protein
MDANVYSNGQFITCAKVTQFYPPKRESIRVNSLGGGSTVVPSKLLPGEIELKFDSGTSIGMKEGLLTVEYQERLYKLEVYEVMGSGLPGRRVRGYIY